MQRNRERVERGREGRGGGMGSNVRTTCKKLKPWVVVLLEGFSDIFQRKTMLGQLVSG